ncbi:recombinase family protein [Sphingobium sp. Sx8-8]|uniref:recombinase family protein n=1 Tax=Sphingobium sp. Sx8-8 TaxID=2933617 RepID=UPI0032AED079
MAILGHARVSTDEQDTAARLDAPRAAGCATVFGDKASGASRERPQLARTIARAGEGGRLLVVRIDRLARPLSHLLEIMETPRKKKARFRSINDPIDTGDAQGAPMTQMLGTFSEFERTPIRERGRADSSTAVVRGAKPGNPRMRTPSLTFAMATGSAISRN